MEHIGLGWLILAVAAIGYRLSAISFCSGRNAGGGCIYLRVDQSAYLAEVDNLSSSRLSAVLAAFLQFWSSIPEL